MNKTTKGMMYFLVGAYIAYMGYKMYTNTVSGLSTMSMTTTIILMILMIAAGLLVVAYSIKLMVVDYKEKNREYELSEKMNQESSDPADGAEPENENDNKEENN